MPLMVAASVTSTLRAKMMLDFILDRILQPRVTSPEKRLYVENNVLSRTKYPFHNTVCIHVQGGMFYY